MKIEIWKENGCLSSNRSLIVALGKGVGSCYSERQRDLTTHPGDAGASPEWASVLAAVEALDDRASAPDGGVRSDGTFIQHETICRIWMECRVSELAGHKRDVFIGSARTKQDLTLWKIDQNG